MKNSAYNKIKNAWLIAASIQTVNATTRNIRFTVTIEDPHNGEPAHLTITAVEVDSN